MIDANAEKPIAGSRKGMGQIGSTAERTNADTETTGSERKFERSADIGLAVDAPHGHSSDSHYTNIGRTSPPEQCSLTAPSA